MKDGVLERCFLTLNPMGDEKNIVDGLLYIGNQLGRVATALEKLGLNDAHTQMGAIETLAKEIKEGLHFVAECINQ